MGKKLIAATMALVMTLLVGLNPIALAASPASPASNGAGQGLEISPPLIDLKVNPGQTVQTQIRLRNVTTETVVTKAQYDDFVAKGEDGQPALLLGANEQSPYSIKSWLSTIPSVRLAPGEQRTLAVSVKVPANAGPGGHYGVVRFTAAPPEVDQSAVSLSASVGTLILARVSGDISEKAQVAELYAAHNGHKSSLFEYGPLDVVTRIRNTGNVHFQPTGTVRVTNMFGKETASFSLNQNKGNVLPSSIRKFQNRLNKKLLFGRYTLQADVVYGSDQKIASASGSFWVIPYKLVIIAIALIAVLIWLGRSYNRYIIRRSANKNNHGQSKH
jgi:hypothetical protein